ncbi:MAG: type II secretion system protein [Psychromonas sp.]|nr:type II secretion system protein [Psychromonas sp.]
MFTKNYAKSLMSKFAKVDINNIADQSLRSKASKLRRKQAGFTLLELLVVVAILAAIAGTASIALKDTDARASAAAHVTMMDELNKGIRTYRVLNKNSYPDRFDSLLQADVTTAGNAAAASYPVNELVAIEDIVAVKLTAGVLKKLNEIGITELRYLDNGLVNDFDGNGTDTDCASANITNTIASRSNHVVSNNIFLGKDANGCGASVTLAADDKVAVWNGGYERVYGGDGAAFDKLGSPTAASFGGDIVSSVAKTPVLMAVGLGPSANLFNANAIGGMTTVPSYRHVSELQYGRFIALFEIGEFTDITGGYSPVDQVNLIAIVDGAGDTKEEELGEWDGTRNTI